MKNREFSKACDIVENRNFGLLFKNSGKFRGRSFFLIIKNWKKIVGKDLSEKIHVNRLQNDILFISVPDSSWMNHILFMKEDIKRKLKTFDESIRDLKFVVDRKSKIKWEKEQSLSLDDIPVEEKKIEKLEKLLESISDEKLRQNLKELYIKKEKFRKYSEQTGKKNIPNL